MPFHSRGIGTNYYGRRDIKQDGSYITTEWIIFIYFPVFPIASFRVRPTGNSINVVVFRSTKYHATKVPLCLPQVRNTYIAAAIALVSILLLASILFALLQ